MGAESKGQVGGMEGSEEVRREFARESRGWVCRECGGSNEEVMKRWWEVCRERGVEVDVEGCEVVGEKKEGEDGEQRVAAVDESASSPAASVSTSANPSVPPVPSGLSSTPAVVPSAPSTQSIRPRPTPTTPAPAPVAMAARTAAATSSEPANNPWLDRAIIGIVFALIILVTKRVVNVDDL